MAILAHNGQAYVDLIGAAARLGAIVVPINWRLSAEEVAYVIEDVALMREMKRSGHRTVTVDGYFEQ